LDVTQQSCLERCKGTELGCFAENETSSVMTLYGDDKTVEEGEVLIQINTISGVTLLIEFIPLNVIQVCLFLILNSHFFLSLYQLLFQSPLTSPYSHYSKILVSHVHIPK
jgi:hypothetical protein